MVIRFEFKRNTRLVPVVELASGVPQPVFNSFASKRLNRSIATPDGFPRIGTVQKCRSLGMGQQTRGEVAPPHPGAQRVVFAGKAFSACNPSVEEWLTTCVAGGGLGTEPALIPCDDASIFRAKAQEVFRVRFPSPTQCPFIRWRDVQVTVGEVHQTANEVNRRCTRRLRCAK